MSELEHVAPQLTDQQIEDRIREALAPLRCDVEFPDFGTALEFVVHLPGGNTIHYAQGEGSSKADTRSKLDVILLEVRRKIAKAGHSLRPWE